MKLRTRILIAIAALALLAGGLTTAYLLLWQEEPSTATPEGIGVAEALDNYGDDAAVLLPVGADDELIDGVRGVMPPGTRIVADPERWAPNGLDGGTIPAEVILPDGTSSFYVLLMARDNQNDDRWVVLTTYETEGPTE
jgi:hypothetical protein